MTAAVRDRRRRRRGSGGRGRESGRGRGRGRPSVRRNESGAEKTKRGRIESVRMEAMKQTKPSVLTDDEDARYPLATE